MKIIFVLILIVSVQNIFGQNYDAENQTIISLGILNENALILQMPNYPPSAKADFFGSVSVETKINLQTGEVVSAKGISGHPLLRMQAEKAALKSKFPPTLIAFSNVFGHGFLNYKIEDFNGKTIENNAPKSFPIINKGIINILAKNLPEPYYSPDIKVTGSVKVKVLIDVQKGTVILAKSLDGHQLLRPFAEVAARKTIFNQGLIKSSEPIYLAAFLFYRFNSDRTVETEFNDGKIILGTPLILPELRFPPFSGKIRTKRTSVYVRVEIDENGNVILAKTVSGHPILRAACETAARKSKFSKTTISEIPVRAEAILIYEFNLNNKSKTVKVRSIEGIKLN